MNKNKVFVVISYDGGLIDVCRTKEIAEKIKNQTERNEEMAGYKSRINIIEKIIL